MRRFIFAMVRFRNFGFSFEAGLEVLGLSLVTNAAAGLAEAGLDHAEVLQAGRDAGPRLASLLAGIVGVL